MRDWGRNFGQDVLGYAAVAVERRAGTRTSHYIAVYRMYRSHFDQASRTNPAKYVAWYPQKPSTSELTTLAQRLTRERGTPFTVHPVSYRAVRTPTPGWSLHHASVFTRGRSLRPQQHIHKDPDLVTDVPGDKRVFNKTVVAPAIRAAAERRGVTLTDEQIDDILWLVAYHSLYNKRGIEAGRPENVSRAVLNEAEYALIPAHLPRKLTITDADGQTIEVDTATYYANGVAVWTRPDRWAHEPYLSDDEHRVADKMYRAANHLNRTYLLGVGSSDIPIAAYTPDTETILLNLQAANSMYINALDYIRQNNIVPNAPDKDEIEKELALDIAGIAAGRLVNHELVHHLQRVGEMEREFLTSEKTLKKREEIEEAVIEACNRRGINPPSPEEMDKIFGSWLRTMLNLVTDSSINALESVNPIIPGIYPERLGLESPRDPYTLFARMLDKLNPSELAEIWADEQQARQAGGQQAGGQQAGGQQGGQSGGQPGGTGSIDPNKIFADAIRGRGKRGRRGNGPGGDGPVSDEILSPEEAQETIEKDLRDAGVNPKVAEEVAARAIRNHLERIGATVEGRLPQGRSSWWGRGMTEEGMPINIKTPRPRRNPVLDEIIRHIESAPTTVPPGARIGTRTTYTRLNWPREVAQIGLPNRRIFPTQKPLYSRPIVVMVDTSGFQLNDEDLQKAVDIIHTILTRAPGQRVYVAHWADGMTPATIRKPIILEGGRSSKKQIEDALRNPQSGGTDLWKSLNHLREAIERGAVHIGGSTIPAPEWSELESNRPAAVLVVTDGHVDRDDAARVASNSHLRARQFYEDAPFPPMYVLYTHDQPNTLRNYLDKIPGFARRHAYVGDRGAGDDE